MITGPILALDLGFRCGWACGPPWKPPAHGAVRLKLPEQEQGAACWNMSAWFQRKIAAVRPVLVVKEEPLRLSGFARTRNSESTVRAQLGLHFLISGLCHGYRIKIVSVHPATVRKHFIGRGNAGSRSATKAAVVRRCHVLKLMPRSTWDEDRADAIALHDFASATYGRRSAAQDELILFGEK